jgi:hypothetical protein
MVLFVGWTGLCLGFVLGVLWATQGGAATRVAARRRLPRRHALGAPGRIGAPPPSGYAA